MLNALFFRYTHRHMCVCVSLQLRPPSVAHFSCSFHSKFEFPTKHEYYLFGVAALFHSHRFTQMLNGHICCCLRICTVHTQLCALPPSKLVENKYKKATTIFIASNGRNLGHILISSAILCCMETFHDYFKSY